MKHHISFGSINKFSTVCKEVRGLPTVRAIATEKVHGTNAAVCFNTVDGAWIQSRKNIISTDTTDNAGCAEYCEANMGSWLRIIGTLAAEYKVDLSTHTISVFFEWAGGNIQKKSCCSGMEKRAVIFQHFLVTPIDCPDTHRVWKETKYSMVGTSQANCTTVTCHDPSVGIYNVMDFQTWPVEIDFLVVTTAINRLIHIVDEYVEPNSPMGREMGIDGNIGEGVVVTFMQDDILHRFKVKGEKHTTSKVAKLKAVDCVAEQGLRLLAQDLCPAWRLEQMLKEFGGDPKNTGNFIRAVIADILKEDQDVLDAKGVSMKEVGKFVGRICATYFLEEIEK